MKLRTGFVSNSSSASFIVAVKKQDPCPTCKRSDPDFLDLVEGIGRNQENGYETTKLRRRGSDLIYEYWMKDIIPYSGEGEKDRLDKLFELMVEAEHKGYSVGEIEISYHDPSTESIMQEFKARNALVMLWSDHYEVKEVKL